jgi:hypothetical protein
MRRAMAFGGSMVKRYMDVNPVIESLLRYSKALEIFVLLHRRQPRLQETNSAEERDRMLAMCGNTRKRVTGFLSRLPAVKMDLIQWF